MLGLAPEVVLLQAEMEGLLMVDPAEVDEVSPCGAEEDVVVHCEFASQDSDRCHHWQVDVCSNWDGLAGGAPVFVPRTHCPSHRRCQSLTVASHLQCTSADLRLLTSVAVTQLPGSNKNDSNTAHTLT